MKKSKGHGGKVSKGFKLTSVKKLLILCIVPEIKESYENIALLFSLVKINHISFKFVSDLKVTLIINGMQTAKSTFGCPYCYVKLRTPNTNEEPILRNYGDIRRHYEKFCLLDNIKKNAKYCFNVTNPPIFEEEDETEVLQKCITPELHILQGFVNHLFFNGLVPLLGKENAYVWPKKLNIVSKNYQGELFEGNACRRLIKEAEKLYDKDILKHISAIRLMPFVESFKAMDKIVTNCFSSKVQVNKYELKKYFVHLENVFKATELSYTLKIHILLNHVLDTLLLLDNNDGLGLWSEQSIESVHREFLNYWSKYKINKLDNPRYGTHLVKCVIEFSSKHL